MTKMQTSSYNIEKSNSNSNSNSNNMAIEQCSEDFLEVFRQHTEQPTEIEPEAQTDSEESASASASADINTTSQKEVYFCAKGALDDLEDATQFAVAMTNQLNQVDSESTAEDDMDYGFLLDEQEQQQQQQQPMMLPTPIDTNRIHVVPSVVPSLDLLGPSERRHLSSMLDLLKTSATSTSTDTAIMSSALLLPQVVVSSSSESDETTGAEDCEEEEEDLEDASTTSEGGRPSCAQMAVPWNQRFSQLLAFRQEHGHVNVPYDFPANPPLAQWVKRQRHQYRLLKEGRHSNLTPIRLNRLESIDYCWDSREAHWHERFYELGAFYAKNGHVRVSKRTATSLAVWLKRQRHQGRQFLQGKLQGKTNMTQVRLNRLLTVGVKFAR